MKKKPITLKPDTDPMQSILNMRVWIPGKDFIGRILSHDLKLVGKGSRSKFICRRTCYVLDTGRGIYAQAFGVN